MNKIFKVVLNKATGRLVVVSELVKSVGKSNSVTDKRSSVAGAVLNMVIIGGVGLFGTQALADVKESIDDSKNNVVYGANLDVNTTTTTTNQNLTVFGSKSTVVGSDSVVFGSNHNISGGSNNIAIGRSITAQAGGGAKVTLFGQDINYTGNTVSVTDGTFYSNPGFAVAVGNGLKARYNTVIVGNDNETTATLTTTLGILAKTNNDRGIAVGYGPEVKKALDGIAIGTKAVVDGNMSMAIGKDAKALQIQATALGPETKANGLSAVALGMRAQADGRSSSALGPWAEAHGKFAAAFGTQAFAVAENSTAIGQNAKANALNSTALGSLAVTTQDAEQSLAVGYNTNVSGKQSLAVGIGNIVSANYAGAIGDPSVVKGEGSYTLGNDNAIGSTAKNVGSFGNNNQIAITVPYTPEGKLDISNPSALLDIADPVVDSRVVGNRNYVNTSNTYVLGSGVGVKDDGTVLGTVKNSVYLGDDSTVATGAAVGTKNLDKEGVEGVTTTAGNEGTVDEATINGVTYGGFAGNKATGAVTVGAAGSERRLMNVAAGEISASSTDAINGSQLFIVARTLMDQYPVIYTDTEGNKVYKQPDGSFVKSDGSVVDPVNVIASMNDGDDTADTPKTLSNVASNLPSTYNTDVYNTGGVAVTKEQTLPVDAQGAALNVNNAATVGDILNAGWNLQGNGVAQDFVKPYDTVDFVDGGNTKAVVSTDTAGKKSLVQFNVSGLPVSYTTADGTPVVKVGSKYFKVDDAGNPSAEEVPAADLVTNMINPEAPLNEKGQPSALGNVGSALATTDVTTAPTGVGSTGTSPIVNLGDTKVADTTAATVGDLRNMGWVVSATGNGYVDTVKNANKVEFVGTGAATVTGTTDANSQVRTITIDVNAQQLANNSQLPVVYTDKDGKQVYPIINAQGDVTYNTSPDGKGTEVAAEEVITSINGTKGTTSPTVLSNVASNLPSTYNTDVYNTGGVAVTKEQTLPVDAQGAALNVNNAATVGDILNAGWNLQGNGVAQDFVKPYDTVDFVDGAGTLAVIETAKDGASNTIRYDLNVDNSTIIINDEGKLVANYADAVKAATTKVEAGDNIVVTPVTNTDGSTTYTVATKKDVEFESVTVGPVVINQDGVNAGGTKITNVAPGDISADSQDAVNGSQLFKELETINGNIASSKEEVQSTDNSVLVTTTQNEAGANVYDLSVNTDGKTITKDANGSLTVNTTSLTNKADGSINTPASPDAIATAGDVANAINNAGFSLSAQGANASLVKPGSAVDMNNTDGNISISKSTSGNKVTYNLSKDIKVDSVSAGDTLVNNDGITIINGNTDGQAVSITKNGLNNGGNRITNVAPGIDGTDAVNVSQLKQLGGDINNQINKVDSDARAGIAQAMATAGLPQAYLPGKSMMAFASGRYRGEMGYAVGYSTISDGGNWVLKASASGNSRGSTGVTLGVGYQW